MALTVLDTSATLVAKSKKRRPVEMPIAANRKTTPRAIEFMLMAVIGRSIPSNWMADFCKMCFVIFPIRKAIRIIPNNAKMCHNLFPMISNSTTVCKIFMTTS